MAFGDVHGVPVVDGVRPLWACDGKGLRVDILAPRTIGEAVPATEPMDDEVIGLELLPGLKDLRPAVLRLMVGGPGVWAHFHRFGTERSGQL